VIQSIQSREDDLYKQLRDSYQLAIEMHDTTSIAIQGQISFGLNHTSIDNLITLAEAMETNKESELKNLRTDLVSLLQVKLEALEHLHDLQNSYANNVEVGDAATLDDLQRISAKWSSSKSSSKVILRLQALGRCSQTELNESVTQLASARSTFERFKAAADERHNVFANFEGGNTGGIDIQDNFRSALLTHLSQQIVVKEHRDRYQFEQLNRLVVAKNAGLLQNTKISLEDFCERYASLIETQIEASHGYMSPKILANYDDQAEETIKPLNSTFFYYFFSADRTKRAFARWLLSTFRFPNQKMRMAYMRFFS